jgi:hypothetical protein
MSVGLDNSRMLALKAQPDPDSLVFDFSISPHSPPHKPELYPTLSPQFIGGKFENCLLGPNNPVNYISSTSGSSSTSL